MEEYEIELYEPMKIAGRQRPAGWKGVVTQSYVKQMNRKGAGIVIRRVPKKESLEDLTVEQLRDRLRAQDKPVSGTKDELIARLQPESHEAEA